MSGRLQEQLALLPDYLGNHLLLTLSALLIGLVISVPLVLLALRVRPLRGAVLAAAAAIQTIPSLALLALMVPLLGRIGFVPALLALVLYSVLPVMRNAVTGIEGVDPSLIEAGRALGMTDGQLLRRVQLPLALPVIIAGVRTAAVWVVGIATLSTPVGATSLGNYIFSGLQTQNYTAVLVGCAAAAGLALLLDGLIGLLESGAQRRSRPRMLTGLTLLALLVVVGLAPLHKSAVPAGEGAAARAVRFGTKTFTEQYILAELVRNTLEPTDFNIDIVQSLGSTVAFDALVAGRIDGYVDYAGTLWANRMQRTDNPGRATVLAELREWLATEQGIRQVIELGFENSYALAMRRERAAELGVATIADLARHAGKLRIGSDYEFFARPEWPALQLKYGLGFADRVSMDSSLMYAAVAEGQVDVITAFSTDGRIAAYDLVVLDDPRGAFPPYDALLLLGPAQGDALAAALAGLAGAIDNAAMRAANRRVDVEGGTLAEAAKVLQSSLRKSE